MEVEEVAQDLAGEVVCGQEDHLLLTLEVIVLHPGRQLEALLLQQSLQDQDSEGKLKPKLLHLEEDWEAL